jgi:hypothetical protein
MYYIEIMRIVIWNLDMIPSFMESKVIKLVLC